MYLGTGFVFIRRSLGAEGSCVFRCPNVTLDAWRYRRLTSDYRLVVTSTSGAVAAAQQVQCRR